MSKKTTLITCIKIIALFCLQLNGEEETRQQARLRMASCTLAVSRSRSAIPEAKNMFEVAYHAPAQTAGDNRLSDPCQDRRVSTSRRYQNVSISRERHVRSTHRAST